MAIALFSLSTTLHAASSEPEWQIIKTKYPTKDVVIAGYNVEDFGAKGDGNEDCTKAFQNALNAMKEAGGGTVFVPEGKYTFKGSLEIPPSVTLRGDWKEPTKEEPGVRGTLLMPLGGKGDPDGTPFISVDYCGGIMDLNIWYPAQSPLKPDPYPWTLIQKGGNNATFENLTLVNPYQGIRIGPGANELHLVRNVYGTPLKTGIQYDSTTDIGRLEKINFSPRWWCQSKLPEAPRKIDWIKKNGTAIHMLRSDWEYVAHVEIDGYSRGYFISEGVRGAANAQFYNLSIRNCGTALEVEKTNPFGMVFTECSFDGIDHGVLLDEKFKSAVMFSSCIFSGIDAILCNGDGSILLDQCRILRGNIQLKNGAHSILGSALENRSSQIQIEKQVIGVILAGNTYPSSLPAIRNNAKDSVLQNSDEKLPLNPIPDYPVDFVQPFVPPRVDMVVVPTSGSDDTQTIQTAINEQARKGGGIVFLPGGDYRIKGHLNIAGCVELRGIHDVPHHTMGAGSVLHIYPQDDAPTITMESASCMRGLSFNYPEQSINDVKEYPFLIQGRGSDICIINVNASNPFKFIDFMTHRCDNHFIDYPSGAPFMIGVAVGGGSRNGVVQNMQFNPHYWSRVPNRNPLYANRTKADIKSGTGGLFWTYQKENMDALVVGDTANQFLYQNFVFGSLYGIHFVEQGGKGAINCISHGHGTDGSKIGCYFEYGHGEIYMINSELVAMSSQNKTAIKLGAGFNSEATLINSMVWGRTDLLAEIENGTLTLQNMRAYRHGKGLLLKGGNVYAANLTFSKQGNHFHTMDGKAELTGVITVGPFETSGALLEPNHVIERPARRKK
ncbi:hypothetical protein PDESU_01980 [Pontiella desulfatans]|uniref:Rhamnogalacturonase A/B/Epimerase-like pectate lyase domain-containing protein n=1 Tax=Pontiella desulfatans TaxID=2750659 RepID=A0A6C2U0M3_PONDE|nr:glycosyl hydrolase family 28-related protein [Pontiella desulfatans]VGO13423.1 hypothetical protein PDESU_01980 [Pontiella desulfatans]